MNNEQKARFWAQVQRGADDECWPWLAAKTDGYGRFSIKRKLFQAHRLSFEESGQHIPGGLVLDHKCRNRSCVNPRHLRPVTRLVNVHENSDAVAHRNSMQTHCRQGHPFAGDNLFYKDGKRNCRECQRRWRRASETKSRKALHESPTPQGGMPDPLNPNQEAGDHEPR